MTRILLRRFSALAVAALFIAILIVSISSLAPAQLTASGVDNSGRVPITGLQTKMSGPALDQHDPLFLPAVIYGTGGGDANSAAVADVNGDGKLDVVVANACVVAWYGCSDPHGVVGVLLGNGDGTFQPAVTYASGGSGARTIAVGDVNGDHKSDILVVNETSAYKFGLLMGNGDGTFQPVVGIDQSSGSAPWSLAVADVDGDGSLDVVVGNRCFSSDDCEAGAVSVSLGNGDGTFQPAVSYRVFCGGFIAVAVADVNGDDTPDVLASVCVDGMWCWEPARGAAVVLLGVGDGTFKSAVTYDSGGNFGWSMAVADVNRDGKPDLLAANGTDSVNGGDGVVGVLLGNGDGTFQPGVTFSSGGDNARSAVAEDVNADGAPDLLVANYYPFGGRVGVLLGSGDGTFAPAVGYDLRGGADTATSIAVGDVNGDGRADLVVAAHASSQREGKLGVLLNNTGPHSSSTTTLVSDANPAAPKQLVTYSATVTGETGEETGTIAFQDGSSTIANVPLVNSRAVYATMYNWGKPVGAHAISAVYSGDLHNAGSTSATLTEYVGFFPVASKIMVTTSVSPSLVAQPVTFAASVSSAYARYGAIPDGELVWFYDGTTVLGSVPLAGGGAEYTTSALSAKTHTIKATYPGDAIFKPSTNAVTQVVNKNLTTTALRSTPNPSAHGQAVTFKATVTPSGPYALTGKVKFWDGSTGIGTVLLNGGIATLTRSDLALGTHPIMARYLGDAASAESTSSVLNQVVQ